jgi:hypothetical protein
MFQTGFHRFKPICQVFLKLAAIRDQGRDDCIEIQGKTKVSGTLGQGYPYET